MTALLFVNFLGETVDTTKVAAKREKKEKVAKHEGWVATGVSPETMAAGMAECKALGKAFDHQAFVRNAKRSKIRTKPYFSEGSANDACRLAERAGWSFCYPVEKKVD